MATRGNKQFHATRGAGRSGGTTSSRASTQSNSRQSARTSSYSNAHEPARSSKRSPSRTARPSASSARTTRSSRSTRSTRNATRTSVKNSKRVTGRVRETAQVTNAADDTRSIGEIKRSERRERAKKNSRRFALRIVIIVGIVVALIAGWAALYNSSAFTITNVEVEGVEHLTSSEMSQLANVPADATLLRIDTDAVRNRLMQTAWVEDATVSRVFPDTLKISVTEREIEAIVEVPNRTGSTIKSWAIAKDHMWLMPIPDKNSEAAKTTSAQIYEDAETALHITDVPYGTSAEIGQICTDSNVNNALDIIAGMTTDLANHIQKVSAAGPAETTLLLDSGVEIAFGKAENIRDKERVILQILDENPDAVAYINVRMVETPTWRSL